MKSDELLHGPVEARARKTPDALAVVAEGATLTYAQLDARANALARKLADRGVAPDVLAGVCLERSPELVVALLAVLKAGGAYVPLDPDHPTARTALLLEDASPAVVITTSSLAARLPATTATVLEIDREDLTAGGAPAPCLAGPDHLAYVIYTSGSTGRPKGAMNTHGAVVNRLRWMQDAFRLDETDRVLQKTPFSFDVSVWELFWPLRVGARLVLARPGGHRDSRYLVDRVAGEGITTLHFVPSMLRFFLEEDGLDRCRDLRRVIVSGEALDGELQERFFSRLRAPLHNLYGPTEAAVDVTAWTCRPDGRRGIIPIGHPISGVTIHLIDDRLRPVPDGQPGEIAIGGVAVGRGYLNRPTLTAERFVADPFSDRPGARLYRTGDVGRRGPGGEIEYLGRLDHQVKVRGFRVELEEVEAALLATGTVRAAAVTVEQDASGDARLVAWVVPSAPDTGGLEGELRARLRSQLPEYMVPSRFTTLPALPLTSSGKVDRRALAAREAPAPVPAAALPAESSTAARVARIMAEMLGIEQVEPGADFFALGGHSFAAMRVVSRVRDLFRVELNVDQLFRAPTAEGFARLIDERRGRGAGEIQPIRRLPREGTFPLSIFQENSLHLNPTIPYGAAAHNHLRAYQLQGPLDAGALERAMNAMVRRHEAFRTVLTGTAGTVEQRVLPARHRPLRVDDLTATPPEEREDAACALLREEEARPFDVAAEEPWRLRLLRLAPDEHVLVQCGHNLAVDPWTATRAEIEFEALYRDALGAGASGLDEAPFQYGDFVAWEQAWRRGPECAAMRSFWQARLAGMQRLALPGRSQRGPLSGRTLPSFLDFDLVEQLRRFAAERAVTPPMVLLASLLALLWRHTGQENIAVGVPLTGRNQVESESIFGVFYSPSIVRAAVRSGDSMLALLAAVREGLGEAFSHPVLSVLDHLPPAGGDAPGGSPLFQVQFVCHSNRMHSLGLHGLDVQSYLPFVMNRSRPVPCDLYLEVDGSEAVFPGFWHYDAGFLEDDFIAELSAGFERLLRVWLDTPDRTVGELVAGV